MRYYKLQLLRFLNFYTYGLEQQIYKLVYADIYVYCTQCKNMSFMWNLILL